jgi:hypothetical protein
MYIRADDFQGGDAGAFTVQITADAVANTNPGNDQRSQTNERQKLSHAFNKPASSRRAVGTVGDFKTRRGKLIFKGFSGFFRRDIGRQFDPVFGVVQAARLDQASAFNGVHANDGDRTKGKTFTQPVWFLADNSGNFELRRAKPYWIANANP